MLSRVLVVLFAIAVDASAQTPSATALSASPNPSTFGQAVTLTAAVSPGGATGKVTFYDGTSIVGVATLASGAATMSTVLLPSGGRSLRAYYAGDGTYAPSSSTALSQTVKAAHQVGFELPVQYGSYPGQEVAIADLNGDGHPDLIEASVGLTIEFGNGDGTFISGATLQIGSVSSLAVGDFNGDGRPDIVAVMGNVSSPSFAVLLGNGDGTFQPAMTYALGTYLRSVLAGDHAATVVTDANGIATAPTLRADRSVGVFTVKATIQGAKNVAKFHMTNKL